MVVVCREQIDFHTRTNKFQTLGNVPILNPNDTLFYLPSSRFRSKHIDKLSRDQLCRRD